ncbi:MAG TPA: hypothetical protein DEQ20_09845 [Desulfobulbaceae bacterium]|nr:MAG: hypothetical protein A2520_00595 [Deltaproteobacteria bacterium RIFOXYD12_FULL_53_23]HCC55205.1 hypothetical protein [Desulfobulbaceae bacterium]
MIKNIFYVLLLIGLTSCGFREGVTVADPAAYLAFGGNTTGAVVTIDRGVSFALDEGRGTTIESDSGEKEKNLAETHYKITPGKHRIQVMRNGVIVVDRELLIGDGTTRGISVP